MKLRPYQYRAVCDTLMALEASKSALVVMPTGTGKTVVFGHIIAGRLDRGRAMVLAHREELLDQAAEKVERICGAHCEAEIGDRWALESSSLYRERSPVVVSTIQTQVAGRKGAGRMSRFDAAEFGTIIVDEAHHGTADTYRRVLDYYTSRNPACRVVGVTATPDRHDEAALGQIFDCVSFSYSILDAIQDGWLVDIDQQYVTIDALDYSQCRVTAGDLNGGDLAQLMEEERHLQGVASSTLELCAGRTTLVFASSVNHARRLTEIFNRRGDVARLLTGKTPYDERRLMLEAYRNGEFPILVNVGVATEGFDIPGVEVVSVARPTLSRALYAQMIGRGTRPVDGLVDRFDSADERRTAIQESPKPRLLVIDYVGNSGKHKLVHAADILGGQSSDRAIAEAKAIMRGQRLSVRDALRRAEAVVAAKERAEEEARQARIRSAVVGRAEFSAVAVNPFEAVGIEKPPSRVRDLNATTKQVECLERFGVVGAERMSISQASKLIGELIARRQRGLCTYRQALWLKRHGYSTEITKEQASEVIDEVLGGRNMAAR